MRGLSFVLAVVALLVALFAAGAALIGRDGGGEAASDGELRARVAEVEQQLADLRGRRGSRSRRRDEPVPPPPPVAAPAPRPAPQRAPAGAAAEGAEVTPSPTAPRAFLDGWVRSFDGAGEGSEFFRLAVEAFAVDLVEDLRAYLADARQPAALRHGIATMLAAPRFKDDPYAIDALVDALRTAPDAKLAELALAGIARTGDARRATELEGLVGTIENVRARATVVGGMAVLAGEHANAALLRMLSRERVNAVREAIVSSIQARDENSALEILTQTSRDAYYPLRNRAAEKLGMFRSAAARALLDEWLARETKQSVRARLGSARSAQDQIPKYDAARATGPSDVPNLASDHENAWCPRSENGGREWLELSYDTEIAATHVRIFEVYTPGAVVAVEVLDEAGRWSTGWEGEDPLEKAGVFDVALRDPGVRVKGVRVRFDTSIVSGWHEIDAVELVGGEARAWAVKATASSTWGQ